MFNLRDPTFWLASIMPALLGNGLAAADAPVTPPPGASYTYTTPALYLNLTVKQVMSLGNLSTGGQQLLGAILDGRLYSEPGFEPEFAADIMYANDYLTADPVDGIARPACIMTVVPDNNDNPFLMRIGGIDTASNEAASIFGTNDSLGAAIPYGSSYSG